MFVVKLNIKYKLRGCPPKGLPAVDFRRRHNLPEEPTNTLHLTGNLLSGKITSEPLCRRLSKWLDGHADLTVIYTETVEVDPDELAAALPLLRQLDEGGVQTSMPASHRRERPITVLLLPPLQDEQLDKVAVFLDKVFAAIKAVKDP